MPIDTDAAYQVRISEFFANLGDFAATVGIHKAWQSIIKYNKFSQIESRCLTFWHRSFTFNSNKSPTWCNSFSVYYPDVCLQLNLFWAFSRPSSGAQ
jgi:hypothetical protein